MMEGMDMTQAVQGLVNLFVNMDGNSRVMFIRLLVTKMKDDEVDLVLQVIDVRQKTEHADSIDVSKFLDLKVKQEPEEYHDGSYLESSNYDDVKTKDQDIEDEKVNLIGEGLPKIENNTHQSNMNKDVKRHKGEGSYICLFCNKAFITRSNVNRHCKAHIGESDLLCDKCPRESLTEDQLKIHNEEHVNDKIFLCNFCSQSFSNSRLLAKHKQKMHSVEKPYQCQYCEQSFALYNQLQEHRKTHPEHIEIIKRKVNKKVCSLKEKTPLCIICDECGKTLKSESELNRHMFTHTGIKPWACDECPYASYRKSDLKKHKNVHSGLVLKRFSCDKCGKQFANQFNLHTHTASVHDGVQFSCEKCGKQFTNQGNLHTHNASVHEGVRYFCDKCDYSATQKAHLKIHIESVHEKKSVTCNECHKQLSHISALRHHKAVVHEGLRFPCDQCDYKATKKSYLRIHKEKHHTF